MYHGHKYDSPITGQPVFAIEAAAIYRTLLRKAEKERLDALVGLEDDLHVDTSKDVSKDDRLKLRERSLFILIQKEEREMFKNMDADEKEKYKKHVKTISRPLRSFSLYQKDCKACMTDAAIIWKSMNNNQKVKYRIMAQRDRLRFMEDCLTMIKGETSNCVLNRIREKVGRDANSVISRQFDNYLLQNLIKE